MSPEPTCYIIDDDRLATNELLALTWNNGLARPIGTAGNVALGMDFLGSHAVDILFIRISFWDDWLTGKFGISRPPVNIVFLSGRSDKCTRHLLLQIDHHLQPPYNLADLRAFFQLRLNPYFIPRSTDFFFLRAQFRYHVIYFSDLRSIQSKNGILTIRTSSNEFTIVGTLSHFQKRLPAHFNRVGRSLLVANPF